MRTEVVYSTSNEAQEALHQISEKLEKLDIKPSFLFLFLTAGTWKAYEDFNKLLESYYPDAKMLGCIVEGYIAEDEIWTRGVSILLAEFDGEVEVYWANEGSATETVERLGDEIGEGWDSILLMFPAFYFPGKLEFIKFFFNDKRYYHSFVKNKDNSRGVEALEAYSKYLDNKKMCYPTNEVLKVISKKIGSNTPIIGMNLLPLEAEFNTPLVLVNYENIENGIATMCFKGNINAIFHDIFPERGNNQEETVQIIKDYFPGTEEVSVTKRGTAIGEVNNQKPLDFLKTKKTILEDVSQDDFIKKVEEGKQLMATPNILAFISKITNGVTFLGLINSPLSIYPSAFNFENYSNRAFFVGEVFRGGIKVFGSAFKFKKYNSFDFFIIDFDTIMSFGGDVHNLINLIKSESKSFFGVFSMPPSAFLPNTKKAYMSEIDEGIHINFTGTTTILEFK